MQPTVTSAGAASKTVIKAAHNHLENYVLQKQKTTRARPKGSLAGPRERMTRVVNEST